MNIIEKIKMEEGDKAKMYKCPTGHWTIGAGINLEQQKMHDDVVKAWAYVSDQKDVPKVLVTAYYSGNDDFDGIPQEFGLCEISMPEDVRDLWLCRIVMDLRSSLYFICDQFTDKPNLNNRDLVLVDMAYQMGVNGLLKFKKMLAAIDKEDYKTAADELLDSNYARQTPNRAQRNADLLRWCA